MVGRSEVGVEGDDADSSATPRSWKDFMVALLSERSASFLRLVAS